MKVIADSHDAVFTNALSSVTSPLWPRSFAMLTAVSPSVPTTIGSSYSRSPRRRIAGGSLISRLLGRAWSSRPGYPWPDGRPTAARPLLDDVDRGAERELFGERGDGVVVHADASRRDVTAEHRRIVVPVDADLGVATRERVERLGVARQTVRVRAVDRGRVERLDQDTQVVVARRRRRRGFPGCHGAGV